MKPHPRIRKANKWGGAAVTVLLVAVWLASAYGYAGYFGDHGGIAVHSGQLEALWPTTHWSNPGGIPYNFAGREGWNARWGGRLSFNWGFELFRNAQMSPWTVLYVPLWTLPGLFILPTAVAWGLDIQARRRERSARLGRCPTCNYDRAGLAKHAVCPECGMPGRGSDDHRDLHH